MEDNQSILSMFSLVEQVSCTIFDISFRFHVRTYKGAPYLQISFYAHDVNDPTIIDEQWCRKWVLQSTMTDSEVIRTCHKAAQAAVLHELDEGFMYKNVRIFDPHRDVNELCKLTQTDKRKD